MSFDETMCCDGCSSVLGAGQRSDLVRELAEAGGRAFERRLSDGRLLEVEPRFAWRSTRHLGACCANATKFYDGAPVPTPPSVPGSRMVCRDRSCKPDWATRRPSQGGAES